ncbi:peptidylprolyl isomerase [Hyphomicrobium sulfonivorans]|uniref:peptidylprolyl isomerase n=1 Tax=Hyphomicrobium sulfonivorans TaxID=121290 RepID=UPI00156D7D1C|nr:peptidylprolyl isomerase [Hyphomicrobium sulfonivorans]MBI1648623.1 peptidylprolyl isomerase [Hyphomicrobium sulfonivorans]NSL70839.1 peptidylprolyl isomerase [Hyphomicrobium sulfonivorans]
MHRVIAKMRIATGLAFGAALMLALPTPAAVAQEAAADAVVVTIDGKPITQSQLKLAEEEIGSELNSLPENDKRRALAEYLIDNTLFANAALAEKLDETAEFKNYMAYLNQRALREQYFEKSLKGAVDEEEAKKIYFSRLKQMRPEEEFSARHILVNSEDKAKEIRAKVVGGEDFAKLAKENSIDPVSKEDGGDLGYFGVGQMLPEFENAILKLKAGDISEPIKTAYGWHVIKLEDRRKKAPPTFEQVRDNIINSLAIHKAQEKSSDLRNKAKIEYVDPEIKKTVEEHNKKREEALAAARKQAEEAKKNDVSPPPAAAPAEEKK